VGVANRAGSGRAPLGQRLIVGYKFGKAVLQACAATALWLVVAKGIAGKVVAAAIVFGTHSVHPVAVRVAHWLGSAATPLHLHVLALLLGADALVSAAEGWVLRRGYPWGRWLVVVATATLLPLELYESLRRPRSARILVFLINAAIVVYLVYLARRARRRQGWRTDAAS
jgi:uncharacterized membrane protein (DUF2068 family)